MHTINLFHFIYLKVAQSHLKKNENNDSLNDNKKNSYSRTTSLNSIHSQQNIFFKKHSLFVSRILEAVTMAG